MKSLLKAMGMSDSVQGAVKEENSDSGPAQGAPSRRGPAPLDLPTGRKSVVKEEKPKGKAAVKGGRFYKEKVLESGEMMRAILDFGE
jgi:hypothetical protein